MSSRVRAIRYSLSISVVLSLGAAAPVVAQSGARPPLASSDVDDIARLVMLEDRRQFDTDDLTRMLGARHPEVRRRAALAVARINDKRGIALLRARPLDADTSIAATVVFAVGQLRDTSTVAWFDSLLTSVATAPTVATEAAIALGKIKTGAARVVLARYLTRVNEDTRNRATIGEALLSIGRANARGDIAPIVRWTRSPSEELRWRAVWALFRPRDPASIATMIALSKDPSALVRSWAVRGLTKAAADSVDSGASAEVTLLTAISDKDRRVQTEAVRALATYSDPLSVAALTKALSSKDTWVSVSAAEGLGRIRSDAARKSLIAVSSSNRPCALRIVAMQQLLPFAPLDAVEAAKQIAQDRTPYCRAIATPMVLSASSGTITSGRGANATTTTLSAPQTASMAQLARKLHSARRADLAKGDVLVRISAVRAMAAWADTSDLAALKATLERAQRESAQALAAVAAATIAGVERRQSAPPGGGGRGERPPAAPNTRVLADYRAIVERWIVPDYNGAPRPRAEWTMPRGRIELELYPGDAPLAVDDFVRTIQMGVIVGTQFTRVVPDFVDQQETIRTGNTLRDEVNRNGLTRGNFAWATAGLDTGSPGYTLNHTPQPHNEGDFTSMGRVTGGMDVVDRIELGDRILAARMLPGR
jgi:HEAT repeat protein/cyclophilin family peptidyl-prolyl cis-trans isomerase